MERSGHRLVVGVPLVLGLLAGVVLARGGGPGKCVDPIPADKQAELLKHFGDMGIDANKDGTLTCEEVKAFFQAHPELHHHHHGGPPPCTDPIPADKQAELLKRFGDQGIDANKDGTLTCEEVKAFFSVRHGKGAAGCHKSPTTAPSSNG